MIGFMRDLDRELRVRRAGVQRGPADGDTAKTGPPRRRRPGRHRRAVRGGQGVAGRLLDARRRRRGPDRWRSPAASSPSAAWSRCARSATRRPTSHDLGDRGPAARARAAGPRHPRPPARRSSTPARTPCRRRCSPPPSSGRPTACPDNPRSWLITVAARRLVDEWRSESARRRREEAVAALDRSSPGRPRTADDTLTLLFLCCHPALSAPSQLALTLRAVGGLTTAEIAAAFLVPEATMAQRISRAKQRIRTPGPASTLPPPAERAGPAAASCCTCSTWSSTRATRLSSGPAAAAGRPDRRGDPADPAAARAGARRRRGRRAARADAAHRRPAAGPDRRRRALGPARRAGPRPAGTAG